MSSFTGWVTAPDQLRVIVGDRIPGQSVLTILGILCRSAGESGSVAQELSDLRTLAAKADLCVFWTRFIIAALHFCGLIRYVGLTKYGRRLVELSDALRAPTPDVAPAPDKPLPRKPLEAYLWGRLREAYDRGDTDLFNADLRGRPMFESVSEGELKALSLTFLARKFQFEYGPTHFNDLGLAIRSVVGTVEKRSAQGLKGAELFAEPKGRQLALRQKFGAWMHTWAKAPP